MAIKDAKITKGTISDLSADNGANSLSFVSSDTTTIDMVKAGSFGNDVTEIDASKLGAGVSLTASLKGATNLISFTGGKGNDSIIAKTDANIWGGNGKDTFVITTDSTTVFSTYYINDFAVGQDTIEIGAGIDASFTDYSFSQKDVIVSLKKDSTEVAYLNLEGVKDKQVTFAQNGKIVFSQSFQPSGTIEYNADNDNTGDKLISNAKFINAENRSKALEINSTYTGDDLVAIIGGKNNDKISVDNNNVTTITTGKGNDTVVVNAGNFLYLTDYQLGNKNEVIQLGTGLGYNGYEVAGNDVALIFSDTTSSTVAAVGITDALWNQIGKSDKFKITVVDSTGATVGTTDNVYKDPTALYVTKVDKTKNTFDLATATTVGDSFSIDSDNVKSIVFTPSTAINVTADAKYTSVMAGSGKDTLMGASKKLAEGAAFITLNGGKGNDLLYGNVSGAVLIGDVGNDTLRGSKGMSVLEGGAGNDNFLLTGGEEGALVNDYNSGLTRFDETDADGKKEAANRKKELGSDVITVQYDKYNKNNGDNTSLGRASLNSSEWVTEKDSENKPTTVVATDADGYGNLVLNVDGVSWVPTYTTTKNGINETVTGHFGYESSEGIYFIKVKDGDQITIQEQGQKYTQYVDFDRSSNVTVAANYLGLANPDVVKIDGSASNKTMRLVAGIKTNEIVGGAKNDTLIGNTSSLETTLEGGKGNDVFVAGYKGTYIKDYDGANGNQLGKDKIQLDKFGFYGENKISGDNVVLGNITIAGGAKKDGKSKLQQITFQVANEVKTVDKKTGEYSGSKIAYDTMVRSFSLNKEDSVVSGGASTYLEIFSGDIDSSVVVVKASNKGGKLISNGDNVNSIAGGAKADSIEVYNSNIGKEVTVSSGGGNDVIYWDGNTNLVVTDYATTKFNAKGVFSGDILELGYLYDEDNDTYKSIRQSDLGFEGNDVIISNTVENKGTYKLTLKNAKDKDLFIFTDTSTLPSYINNAVVGGYTVSSANIHEYLVDSKGKYEDSGVKTTGDDQTWVVNAATSKQAADIKLNDSKYASVEKIYTGNGNDTVNAYNAKLIDTGKGNDVVYLNGTDTNVLTVTTGVGNDFFVVSTDTKAVAITDYATTTDKFILNDEVHITGVTATAGEEITLGKGSKASVITSSDVTIAVTNGGAITLKNLVPETKITRSADGVVGKAYYSLDYLSDEIEIGAKDFKGAVVNVEGTSAKNINIAKNVVVSVEGAAGKTVKVNADSTKGIFYIGGEGEAVATVNAGKGADVYVAGGAKDIITLGAGNDTVKGDNNKASIIAGEGNNVFYASAKSNYTIDKFSATDKIFLDNATVTGVTADDTAKTLKIDFANTVTVTGGTNTVAGAINLTNYAGEKVTFEEITTVNNKPKLADLAEAHGYTNGTELKLTDTDGALVTFDNTSNQNVTTVDASARTAKKAITITATSDAKVATLKGGAGADTLSAFAIEGREITYTGGDGNDTFIINKGDVANYTITDYAKGDVIYTTDTALFNGIVNFSKNYAVSGKDVIISDTGTVITLKEALGQDITFSNAGTKRTVTLSDPVNVELGKNDTLADWTADTVDANRVKTFDASAAAKLEGIKFIATAADFTKFTGNAKGSTLTISDDVTGAVTISLAGGTNNVTLNTENKADTINVNAKSTTTITNFDATDSLGVVKTTDIKSAAVTDGDEKKVVYTLKNGSLTVTGAGVSVKYDNFKAGDAKGGTGADSGTTKFTFDKIVTLKGLGDYKYGTGTTNEYYASADAAKSANDTNVKPFVENYDVEEFVSDFVVDDDLNEITSAKVAISADDLKSGIADTATEFEAKITASSDLTSNKKE